ncbi:MAG: hypothetical protein E7186_08200 [Erysipelotrichaceae bacterium]|nr:hypothetical protein [Erysipelotrichaceae bacterium]
MSKLKYIFVHGLSGWGSYDEAYRKTPYWGMRNGDLMVQLRQLGYDSYAASVAPHDSAYDRACELYAQLTGTVTDYGRKHAEKYGHDRYGRDFTGKPLIPEFNDDTRLVLFGHSFGGTTIRIFAHIMEHGCQLEDDEDCSPFFKGGMGNRIFALYTVATPHNGTTAYDMYDDPDFDVSKVKVPFLAKKASKMLSERNTPTKPQHPEDCAAYDMHIDNALRYNSEWPLSENIYYFSQPCEMTQKKADGTYYPITMQMELLFQSASRRIGAYKGKTRGGFIIDESWRENDGLVNTVSAAWPLYNDHRKFNEKHIEKGKWNVLDTYHGDHMSLQGGLLHRNKIFSYYLKKVVLIARLDK